jgi:hypothetical protein
MAWISAAVTGVQRGKDSVTYGLKGDWAGSLVNGLALGGKVAEALFKRQASEGFKKAAEAAAKKVGMPTPVYILDAMMLAINLVGLLNGFGDERASSIDKAKEQLENVKLNLEAAIPDSRDWSGDSATAYVNMVTKLQAFVQTMEDLDKEFKGFVVNQADSVKQANLAISYSTLALIAAYVPAYALYFIPIIGAEISMAFQIVAAFAVGAAVFGMEMMTLANSLGVSNQLQATINKFDTLGTSVVNDMAGDFGNLEGTLKGIQGKTTAETSSELSTFRGISDGLTSFSFAPSVSDLAAKAGNRVSSQQRALLNASSERELVATISSAGAQAETPGATPAPAAATPASATPAPAAATPAAATPAASVAFAPPTLAQMSQTSAQLSQMSQPISQVGQTVNQGISQIQQAAQSAKGPGDPAPAPADQVGDVKDAEAGAAAGGEGAERAPVDAAASGGEAAAGGRERVL